MARPKLELDEGLIERLAMIHCPNKEIAAALDCHVDTLTDRYSELIAKGRDKGRLTLRRVQWEAAQKGNVVMMIWLGKQLLGQKDVSRVEITEIPDEVFVKEAERRLKLVGSA